MKAERLLEIIENNIVEYGITLSILEQLKENHEQMVNLAQKAKDREISEYVVAYETLRLADRTAHLYDLVHRLVSGMGATNEELLEITFSFTQVPATQMKNLNSD